MLCAQARHSTLIRIPPKNVANIRILKCNKIQRLFATYGLVVWNVRQPRGSGIPRSFRTDNNIRGNPDVDSIQPDRYFPHQQGFRLRKTSKSCSTIKCRLNNYKLTLPIYNIVITNLNRVLQLLCLNHVFQWHWHLFGKILRIIVKVRHPTVDLVQLEEDARRTLVIRVVVFLWALSEVLDVHVANQTGWRRGIVFAVEDVRTATRRQAGCLVY